jgi:PAS domain S-box-containing protein
MMTRHKKIEGHANGLRSQAETLLGQMQQAAGMPTKLTTSVQDLLHELEVYQIELQIQNEELKDVWQSQEEALQRYMDLYDSSPVAYLTLERDGTIRDLNLRAAALMGYPRARLIGGQVGTFLVEGDWPLLRGCLSEAGGGTDATCEVHLTRAGNGPRLLGIKAVAVPVSGTYRVAAKDITTEREMTLALECERRLLRQVLDANPSLIFVKDRSGRFHLTNLALARCYGTTVEEMAGRTDADFNDNGDQVRRFLHDSREVMDHQVPKHLAEEPMSCADGQVHWLSTYLVPLVDEKGRCDQVLGVATDVTEARETKLALQMADRLKNECLAMLGHELRTPLSAIASAAGVLGQSQLGEDERLWAQGLIERQIGQMTRLIDELYDASRIVQGKIELRRGPTQLASLVAQALEMIRPLIDARGHRLEVSLPSESVWLEGDAQRLSQVLVNLLSNAAKYTKPGGHIALIGEVAGQDLVLQVRDDGPGIPEDLLPYVFDLFVQGHQRLDRPQSGLGLGLSLVKRVVELHGGCVLARNAAVGHGAELTVRLPRLSGGPESCATGPPGPSREVGPVRVLVVEDDPDVAASTALFLELQGHMVRTARDGEAALELAAELRPHLVLLDIGLPGLDGYQVAQRLRALPHGAEPWLVALTGYGDEEARSDSAAAGFDEHLTKPLQLAHMLGLISRVAQGVGGRSS